MSKKIKSIRFALVGMLLLFCAAVQAQTISGNVKDSNGEPIIGATVMEKGTSNGTVTDFDGNFTLKLKGTTNKVAFSYVGMQTKTVDFKGKSTANVVLEDDNTTLNDVVVIGYGTVQKKDLTGSVGQVKAKQIENIPVSNVSEALTGKMAGVNITTTEGSPDADVKIRVRGGGSLSQDNSPLYIVDGFPVTSISDISPSEIETIDVLKDASSTAIYGAQGANGVIIVTTKSGKEGKVQVSLNGSLAWKQVTKTLGVLNPYEYAYYQYELGSGGYSPYSTYMGDSTYGMFSDIDVWKGQSGTDYQDEIFGRTGLQKTMGVNVSGGSKEIKYNVGFQHIDEDAIMRGSGYAKNNVNAKLNANLNKWLTMDFTARLAQTRIDGQSGGTDTNQSNASNSVIARALYWRPVEGLSSTDDSDEDEEGGSANQANPVEKIDGQYKQVYRLQQNYNVGLNWKPWKGWTFRSEFGYYWRNTDTEEANDSKASQNSKYGGGGAPQAFFTYDHIKNWRNANTVTYDNKKLFGGRDHINVMLGQETQSTEETIRTSRYINFPTSFTIQDVLNYTGYGTPLQAEADMAANVNIVSFFGRINYTLNDKYLASVTFREDGSSKFSQGNRWGFFPSAALAWRMSDESWLKDVDWIHNLKLRLSFGTAGNNRIPSGVFDNTYALTTSADKIPYFNETATTGLGPANSTLYNSNLKWETTITRNFGIDWGLWHGRLNGTIDLYWNTTKDLLMKTIIPGNTGYGYQYQNFGQTSNKGIELSFNGAIIEKKNFTLNGNLNISYNKGKIDELNSSAAGWQEYTFGGNGLADTKVWYLEEGGCLGEVYGYKSLGYYTVAQVDESGNVIPGSGDLMLSNGKWVMADGSASPTLPSGFSLVPGGKKLETETTEDGTVQAKKQYLGNTVPKWTGGFGFDAQYKTKIGTFDASVFCNFSLGNKILNATKMQSSYFWGSKKGYNVVSDYALGSRYTWVDPVTGYNLVSGVGTSTNQQALIDYYGGASGVMNMLNALNANASVYNPASCTSMVVTDEYLEDASFLRIQNVTIGYTIPSKWISPLHLTSFRIYFTAYNLACFTKYSGYDPEVDMSSKKNAMCPGVDYASYPKSRSYTLGVNVSF